MQRKDWMRKRCLKAEDETVSVTKYRALFDSIGKITKMIHCFVSLKYSRKKQHEFFSLVQSIKLLHLFDFCIFYVHCTKTPNTTGKHTNKKKQKH